MRAGALQDRNVARGDEWRQARGFHSGDGDKIPLVDYGAPPRNEKERLEVLQECVAHSQFCWSGDNTLPATERAVREVQQQPAPEGGR